MKETAKQIEQRRNRLAVSLCYSSALLLSLEALHPGSCTWMSLDANQSFALSATLATVSMFVATLLLTRLISSVH